MLSKKRLFGLAALLLTFILVAAVFPACKLDGGNQSTVATDAPAPTVNKDDIAGTKVVMSSKHFDLTLYDFGQAFYSSQYFQALMYGKLTPDQYCDVIIDELSNYLYILNAAVDEGVELTEDEENEINSTISEQLEQLLQGYEENVPEDSADKRAAAKAELEKNLAEDGIDFDSFIELATNSFRMSKIASKYYSMISDSVEVTDEDVDNYISAHLPTDANLSVSDFVDKVSTYYEGNGTYPTYICADCFSVNHIVLMLETETGEDGSVSYLPDSRAADEFEIEQRLDEIEGFEEFMELEEEYGEDPGMDNEFFRENGYIIHPDLIKEYYDGFVYAAMNLHEGEWSPTIDPNDENPPTKPALEFFKLKDGTMVVKVRTEPGIHYLILNKEYKRGPVSYESGDAIWTSWKKAAEDEKLDSVFEELSTSWKEKYEIAVDTVLIKAKYAVTEDPNPDKK